MKKILFIAEAVSLAHIGRPYQLALTAHKNNYEVHFACSKEGLGKANIQHSPFQTHHLHTINGSIFYQRIQAGKFFYKKTEMLTYIHEELKLIEKIKPHIIVSDFRLTTAISARLSNVPLINLSNAHWAPQTDCNFCAPDTIFFNLLPQIIKTNLFNLIRPIAFKIFAREFNNVRKHFQLPAKTDFREIYTDGDFTAFMDTDDFTPIKVLNKNQFFIGPVIWNPSMINDQLSENTKESIYISIGSTGDLAKLDAIIQAALKTNFQLILSGISTETKIKLLQRHRELKDRAKIYSLIDPSNILDKCRLVICHGGSGTVYQSLAHGVPVLCLPANPDQYLVSLSVAKKRLGKMICIKKPSANKIEQIINRILNDNEIYINAKDYAKKIHLQNSNQKFIELLNQIKYPETKSITENTIGNTKKSIRATGVSLALQQTIEQPDFITSKNQNTPSGFTIKIANTLEERESAYRLAYRTYLDKGYIKKNPFEWLVKPQDALDETATLIVQDKNKKTVGSVSMLFDGEHPIPAQKIYPNEINQLRNNGEKIVEISRLSIDPNYRNAREILQILFNYLYIYTNKVKNYTCLTIEVNPRHLEYYKQIFGFQIIGDERPCPNVQNAPAFLLYCSLNIQKNPYILSKDTNNTKKNRSLLSKFLNPEQEEMVASYLSNQHRPMSGEERLYFGFTDSTINNTLTV